MTALAGFWTNAAVDLAAGGFGGYHLCLAIQRMKEAKMSGETLHRTRNGFALLLASLAVVLGGVAIVVQQNQRDADLETVSQHFDTFKTCVNDYSHAMHVYQTTNREATSRLQTVQEARDNANSQLWRLITRSLAAGKPIAKPVALNALGRYNAAAAAATQAKNHLDAVRAAHPVPEPPEVACP